MIRVALFFFFNDTATTEIYTLSLHDALPISLIRGAIIWTLVILTLCYYGIRYKGFSRLGFDKTLISDSDRKSTRLNSSHANISYAVFCLKKKKNIVCT